MNAKLPRVRKVCIKCESEFEPKPYRQERARFCSFRCRGSMTVNDWFFHYGWVETPSGCWEWQHKFDPVGGYGLVQCDGKEFRCHRVSFEIFNGSIPSGMKVLHHCDNRPCIRPDHLFCGTDADNVADMDAKGRRYILRGQENGMAKLTDAEVLAIRRAVESGVSLAQKYDVSPSLISLIRLGKVWRHV